MQRRWCHLLAACPILSHRWRRADSNRRSRHTAKSFPTATSVITSKIVASGRKTPPALSYAITGARDGGGGPITVPTGGLALATRCGSSPGRDGKLGPAAVLLFAAALSPPTAA